MNISLTEGFLSVSHLKFNLKKLHVERCFIFVKILNWHIDFHISNSFSLIYIFITWILDQLFFKAKSEYFYVNKDK